MNENDTRTHDDRLLTKERSIKSATILVQALLVLAIAVGIIFPLWEILQDPADMEIFRGAIDDIYQAIGWLIVLLLLVKLNRAHLKHIVSIKLHRAMEFPNQTIEPTGDTREP
jgi:hypothetical protein